MEEPGAVNVAALRSNWRKVSSTDNLQAFNLAACPDSGEGSRLRTALTGAAMVCLAATVLAAELGVLVCKALPPMQSRLAAALQQDQYYVYLVPLMAPMALVAVTVNWFSLKLFRHNS